MDYSELKVPNHVAIIVDGNGRWAKERGMTRLKGHDAGFENLKKICKYAGEKGVKYISLYVFSTENFKRDKAEVDHLMDLFCTMYKKDLDKFMKEGIKVIFSGRNEPLPKKVIKARDELVEATKDNDKFVINFCLNYGGRAEIVDAVNKIRKLDLDEDLTEKTFKNYLYQDLPDVDLMIRTSGEVRLSNFLLYQLSYAEFIFYPAKFPEFSTDDFDKCIVEYTSRDRRFGNAKK